MGDGLGIDNLFEFVLCFSNFVHLLNCDYSLSGDISISRTSPSHITCSDTKKASRQRIWCFQLKHRAFSPRSDMTFSFSHLVVYDDTGASARSQRPGSYLRILSNAELRAQCPLHRLLTELIPLRPFMATESPCLASSAEPTLP